MDFAFETKGSRSVLRVIKGALLGALSLAEAAAVPMGYC
jgi:hypothetical protein